MNLVFGEVVKLYDESGMRMGKVRVHGAVGNVSLELLAAIEPGDVVLVCDGIALSKLQNTTEKNCVSGNSWQAH